MSFSPANFHHQLCSSVPNHRQAALHGLTEQLSSLPARDIAGFSALLHAVSQADPHPSVRLAAVKNRFCPPTATALALFDSNPTVRLHAARRCASTDKQHVPVPDVLDDLLALLTVESDEDVVLEVLQALGTILASHKGNIALDHLLGILGCASPAHQDRNDVFCRRDSYAVIRDMAEHDSFRVRAAVCHVLFAVAARGSAFAAGEGGEKLMYTCFEVFELLVQDTDAGVQMSAVAALVKSALAEKWKGGGEKVRLSEETAVHVIRLLEPVIATSELQAEETARTLALLLTCPLRTLSGYGLVETFLRRRLYSARCANIEGQKPFQAQNDDGLSKPATIRSSASTMRFLESTLRSIIDVNRDFVRVLDLTRTHSDKYSRFKGMNV